MSLPERVRLWATRFRWALWAFVAVAIAAVTWALHRLFLAPPEVLSAPEPVALQAAREKAAQAEEHALVVQASATATATAHREELTRIMANPEGGARRAQLAAFLQNLPP